MMINEVLAYMQQYSMIPENGNIVAGVSGGPDSVCLLLVLVRLREKLGLHLHAVHINHGLRAEAGMDAEFVRNLCIKWDVPLHIRETDIKKLSSELGIGSEEAGRRVRYAAFEEQLEKMDLAAGGHGCIAVAHNRDDRAETFLFHLLRGTGLDGMAGIRPVRPAAGCETDRECRDARIIRPLLDTGRDDIEAFLRAEQAEWRIDATNAEDMYTRNRIRNRILPYAERFICHGAKEHLAREAALLAQTADYVRGQTQEALSRCQEGDGEQICISAGRLWQEAPFLQRQCIRECLLDAGSGRDLTAAHVEAALALADPFVQSGRRLRLPICRVEVVKDFDRLIFRPIPAPNEPKTEKNDSVPAEMFEIPLIEGHFTVPGLGAVMTRLFENVDLTGEKSPENAIFLKNIPQKKYTKWVDYDKIIESAVFRTRRQGDYLTINENLEKKSLKKYMIEEKIPADERDRLMLLADGAHIIWVPGHRISAAYKVTAQTAAILEIYLQGGNQDG